MKHRRSGVTMIIALMSMALVSAAIVTLANQSVAQTRAVGYRAQTDQLDQLLLAAIPSAIQHLQQPTATAPSWAMTLPAELADANVEMNISQVTPADADVHVVARWQTRQAHQTLRFHFDGQWRLASITLD